MNKKYIFIMLIIVRKCLTFLAVAVLLSGLTVSAGAAGTLIPLASATYNGAANNYDGANGVVLDAAGNIIVTGTSNNGANNDFFTIKYNSDMVVLSSVSYNGPTNDKDAGVDAAVDTAGNIIVTGIRYDPFGHYFTIKYGPNLVALSSAVFSGPGSSWVSAAVVDPFGNIIITGYSYIGTSNDYLTIKYDQNLVMLSSVTYNGPGNSNDTASGLAVDSAGNIIVTGHSNAGGSFDFLTIKYDANLVVIASATYDGPAHGADNAYDAAVDADGNIIVTGYSANGTNDDYFTIKYDPNLVVLASAAYSGPEQDTAYGVAVDAAGNIIVTGASGNGTNSDFFTIKYSPDLTALFSSRYNGSANSYDNASDVTVDAAGNIFVVGISSNGANSDFFTIKYNGMPPGVTGASPAFAEQGTTFDMTVIGSNFLPGAAAGISGPGITVNSTEVVSKTLIKLNVTIATDAPAGERFVTVTNTDTASATLARAFRVTSANTKNVDPSEAAEIKITPESGEISVGIAAGTFSQAVSVMVSTACVPSSSKPTIKVGNICLEITNSLSLQPGKPVTITVNYRDADIVGLEESKLVLCRYDAAKDLWIPLPTTVDAANNVLTATTDHLSTFVLVQLAPAENLGSVLAFPNPFSPKDSSLTIANLTGEAEIKIYNVAGELVRTLNYATANGRSVWDGKNDGGNNTASGVYIAFIKSGSGKKTIKIALER